MDDNKILTLPSNERIPLLPNMKMIFEIRDLKYATPATVSRAGMTTAVPPWQRGMCQYLRQRGGAPQTNTAQPLAASFPQL